SNWLDIEIGWTIEVRSDVVPAESNRDGGPIPFTRVDWAIRRGSPYSFLVCWYRCSRAVLTSSRLPLLSFCLYFLNASAAFCRASAIFVEVRGLALDGCTV